MNVAVVGGGMIGRTHIANLRLDGRAEVRWICSRSESTVDSVREEFGIPHGTTRLEDVLGDGRTDSVIIATPPRAHAEAAAAAIRAGKHVLIEKPLAPDPDGAAMILEELERRPDIVALSASARHTRLQPRFPVVHELVRSGEIGEVYYIHHQAVRTRKRYGIEYNPDAAWSRSRATAGGGPLLDWGVYDLSFHLGLLDDRPDLTGVHSFLVRGLDEAAERWPDFDVEEHGAALMRFAVPHGAAKPPSPEDLDYFYERGSNAHLAVENESRIYGSRGAVRLDYHSWGPPGIEVSRNTGSRVLEVPPLEPAADHQALIRHFADCLLEGVPPAVTPRLEAKHMDILFAVLAEPPRDLTAGGGAGARSHGWRS